MPVLFKLFKMVRTYKDNRQDSANNKWFARAINVGTVGTDELADKISYATTVTPSDCVAVLKALGKVMGEVLCESHAVKLENIGTFSVGLKCQGAETVSDFSVNSNITGARINFQPEYTINRATGRKQVPMLSMFRVKETSYNDVSHD